MCCVKYSTSSPSFLCPYVWLCHRYCTAILCCSCTQVNYNDYDSFCIVSVPVPVLFLLLIWDCLIMVYILFVACVCRQTSACNSYYYDYYCYYYYFVIDCSSSVSSSHLVSFHGCCCCWYCSLVIIRCQIAMLHYDINPRPCICCRWWIR